jgi:NAD(P)H dehydrogenase (quinone)
MADSAVAVARGDLLVESGDLSRLIGRPTTGLADAIRAALG